MESLDYKEEEQEEEEEEENHGYETWDCGD